MHYSCCWEQVVTLDNKIPLTVAQNNSITVKYIMTINFMAQADNNILNLCSLKYADDKTIFGCFNSILFDIINIGVWS